uniref:type 2 DNA topoisomerase 6 subunit B-like isoform X2 n=1 Tax=Jaculus jaculus TaxID=51337 RepID=UPI001E1B5804|nr:type 2 DNA topoisomerase 6 subunit B-like isoform X2 [Jaculus jaculus]
MEGTALAVCEILKYLIIHWKCQTTISKRALLEGQLVISIEALSSKHQPHSLHCIATISSAGSICGGLVLKKFLKEIQSILPRLSAKLTCTSEESNCFQDTSRVTPFQIIFEVDEKLRTLKTGCLVIKQFLHKIVIVHHKIRFNFNVKVNGILSTVIFGIENEPTLSLSNGIALVTDNQHYMSKPKLSTTESHCSRIHPVLGHPVALNIPDDMAGMDLLGQLVLTPAAALCPSPKVFPSHLNRIASVSIFLYGPLGLPLISSNQEQPSTTVFKDTSYFINWKKYHLCMVPNLDLHLDRDFVLPDVSYQVKSSEETQPQDVDPQGSTLLLFLFVDFRSGIPVQKMEIWGVHTLLTAHLSAILMESHSMVQDSIQITVDQVLEQHHQATKAQQNLQASLAVAVTSIMSVVTGSTCSSFRRTCLQGLQAADTQEFGTKLHKIFHDITQHRFLHHCSCDKEQVTPERRDSAQRTEDALEKSSAQFLADTGGQVDKKKLKSSFRQGAEEMHSARDLGPPQATVRRLEPPAASLTASGGQARAAAGEASLGSSLEDTLWLQEVSNLSEWLSPGPRP